jgi:hypothetical protein
MNHSPALTCYWFIVKEGSVATARPESDVAIPGRPRPTSSPQLSSAFTTEFGVSSTSAARNTLFPYAETPADSAGQLLPDAVRLSDSTPGAASSQSTFLNSGGFASQAWSDSARDPSRRLIVRIETRPRSSSFPISKQMSARAMASSRLCVTCSTVTPVTSFNVFSIF